jgi:hypothetical protein
MGIFSEDADFEHDPSDVIRDTLARHRQGLITVVRAREALTAFISCLAPDGFMADDDMVALSIYLDITLEVSKRAGSDHDDVVTGRVLVIKGIANGDIETRGQLRTNFGADHLDGAL